MRAYTANMIPGGTTPTINVSQYDNDYAVTVTLIEGAEIYTPPVGATIRVEGTKPDGHGFEYPCTYQGNVVTMPIYTQMTVVSGRFPIELVVYQSGLRVGSCNIIFAVERAPLGEDTDISETVIPDIIDAAQASAEAAQEAAETAQEAAAEVLSSQIVVSASGSIATFADGADDVAIKAMTATITPVQSGSGDPSPENIRPISGRTGMTVTRAGKNLLNDSIKIPNSGQTSVTFGQTAGYSTPSYFMKAGTYTFSVTFKNGASAAGYMKKAGDSGNTVLWSSGGHSATFTLSEDTLCSFWIFNSAGIAAADVDAQIEAGTSATAYEPYTAQTYPITWQTEAGTVYGGTLDVVSGVLTVTHSEVLISGLTWTYNSTYTRFGTSLTGLKTGYITRGVPLMCEAYQTIDDGRLLQDVPDNSIYGAGSTNTIYIKTTDYTTASDFVTAMGNYKIIYPLATPQVIQLSPTEIKTLLGGNTIYTDAGSVSVEYVADTKLYIDNKVAELQALILEN